MTIFNQQISILVFAQLSWLCPEKNGQKDSFPLDKPSSYWKSIIVIVVIIIIVVIVVIVAIVVIIIIVVIIVILKKRRGRRRVPATSDYPGTWARERSQASSTLNMINAIMILSLL